VSRAIPAELPWGLSPVSDGEPDSTHATEEAIKAMLKTVFKLN
jgi:hypothetical protein